MEVNNFHFVSNPKNNAVHAFLFYAFVFVKQLIRKFMDNNNNHILALKLSFGLKSLCMLVD